MRAALMTTGSRPVTRSVAARIDVNMAAPFLSIERSLFQG